MDHTAKLRASQLVIVARREGGNDIELPHRTKCVHYVTGLTGTGKTHLAVALGVAACRQRKRVRFTTAAEMVTELIEAQTQMQLTRVRNRWMRYELVVIDEVGYVVMPNAAAELLFQVIAGRAEQASVIVTTNLPFSEWTTKIPNARLCKAMLERPELKLIHIPLRRYHQHLARRSAPYAGPRYARDHSCAGRPWSHRCSGGCMVRGDS
jgi:hypothetical protein